MGMVLLFLAFHQPGQAQLGDYHLQLFDFTYGIKPGTINGMCKDQQGFLWILYARSVQRFDGRDVISYKFPKGVNQISCDSAGRLWVNSTSAIFLFNQVSLDFDTIPIKTRQKTYSIGQVFTAPGPQTWAITTTCFLEYDPAQKAFIDLEQAIPVQAPYQVTSFCQRGSWLFFGHGDKIFRYDVLTNDVDSLPDQRARRLFPLSPERLLVSSWDLKSYWYDFATHQVVEANLPLNLRSAPNAPWSIRSVVALDDKHFLIASQEGLFFYHHRQQQVMPLRLLYKGKPIYTHDLTNHILIDDDQYVWITTLEGIGRFSLLGQTFGLLRSRHFYDHLPSGIDNIRQIVEGRDEQLWIATGHGFIRWDQRTNEQNIYLPTYGSTTQLAFPSIRGIVYDGKNVILGPSDLGIWVFNPDHETYRRPVYASNEVKASIEQDFIDYLGRLQDGRIIVPGRDRLYLLDSGYKLSFLNTPFDRENNNYVFQTRDGYVWISTTKGLYALDQDLHFMGKAELGEDKGLVMAGCPLRDTSILFSTSTKVYKARIRMGQVVVQSFDALSDTDGIIILVEDEKQNIWGANDNGLFRYDPMTERTNTFDNTDNLQGFGYNGNSWCISSRHVLYIGGTNGINYFIPEKIKAEDESLRLFIERVRGGKDDSTYYALQSVAQVPWYARDLECQFVCPYFNNPGKLKYRYKLEGLDKDWKYVTHSNVIRFNSLPPGHYTLELEASINTVDWTPAQNHFTFHIQAPFWMKWWFYLLVLSIASGLLWLFIRSRNQRLQEKQEELEAEQAINYFSARMAENLSVDDMLWDVARNCIGRLQFEDCVIYLLDSERNVLVQKAAYGPKSTSRHEIVNPLEIPVGQGVTGKVALTGMPILIHDTSLEPDYIVDDVRRYSEIAVPIQSEGQVLGVLDCEHSKKSFFTQRHLSILSTIASLCAARITKARAEAQKNETERILMETKQQMAEIEMQALRAQMNPHFIFNCLNSINRYIVKSDQATASLYLTRFAKLIRLILDNSNSRAVTLTNELEALRLYIEMESIRFERKFDYAIQVDDTVQPDHIFVPPLMIQPYVENAIWHGLLHKESSGCLNVRIRIVEPLLLECRIEDNGVGRERAKELKSKSASSNKSLGMKLTESRLALLNRQSDMKASVKIIDLKDEKGQAMGTSVVLQIPVDL